MTSRIRDVNIVDSPAKTGITREAIVTKVIDQPVLGEVIEKKNIEVHHVPIVQEIHEQKIIEIERPKQTTLVVEKPITEQVLAEKKFEEINKGGFTEQDKLKLAGMQQVQAPLIEKKSSVETIKEGEQIQSVVYQPIVERHVVPQITEVREQKIIEVIEQPITRKIIERPIVREVQPIIGHKFYELDNMPLRSLPYQFDSIPTEVLNITYLPSGKMAANKNFLKKRSNMLSQPSSSWKRDRMAIQRRYRLYNPSMNTFNSSAQKTGLQLGYEQFRNRQSFNKYRRYYYNFDKTRSFDSLKKNDPYMEYPTLVLDAWKKPSDLMLRDTYYSEEFKTQEEHTEQSRLSAFASNVTNVVKDTFNKLTGH